MEVFLIKANYPGVNVRLLHARGGVSTASCALYRLHRSSPRSWRCFPIAQPAARQTRVFSTLVEVFLNDLATRLEQEGLLHARGGVSMVKSKAQNAMTSSPRSWRCFSATPVLTPWAFVFSTLVEVFLLVRCDSSKVKCLLHARGGVSNAFAFQFIKRWSSPRSWRCFLLVKHRRSDKKVFSTLVEVFLADSPGLKEGLGLLHARGGVSSEDKPNAAKSLSSPRSWRCFPLHATAAGMLVVFSTLVEVFLSDT